MPHIFKKILIPVDFSINTEAAVKKCLEIIEHDKSTIHLFHVEKTSPWHIRFWEPIFNKFLVGKDNVKDDHDKLIQWKQLIEDNSPGIKVVIESVKGSIVEKLIIQKAIELNPDIIIIGKNSNHTHYAFLNKVSSSHIAKKTGYPVLTVKPGSIHNKIKSIVVPVGSSVPKRKIELILALRKKFRITIHLVTVVGNKQNENDFSTLALLNTYRFLNDVARCPLGHEVLLGHNIAKSALKYAQEIKADMLLVEPGKETRLTSFLEKHISDELMPDSRLQILAVQP